MGIPWILTFQAWIPFPIVGAIGIALALLYYFHFQHQCKPFSIFICIIAAVSSVFVVLLTPVDVFLVSATKTANGSHYGWATNETLIRMENVVQLSYNVIYSLVLILVFIFMPWLYFYKSTNENEDNTTHKKIWRAVKFTFFSISFLALLVVVGVVVPATAPPKRKSLQNQVNFPVSANCLQTEWENALVFAINFLGLVGMICSIIYTAYGMTILPVNLIKGIPSETKQNDDMDVSISELLDKIRELSERGANEQPLGASERRRLNKYSRQLYELQSRSDTMRQDKSSPLRHCNDCCRFVQVFFGFLLLLFSISIVACLIISNVNRIMSSNGIYSGYTVNQTIITNPMDYFLQYSHKVFPFDYILISFILFYFVISSVVGMQHMGIWFLWCQIYRLRYKRTSIDALIFGTFILVCVTLYSGVFIYSLAPQYATYGTQVYKIGTNETAPCSLQYPADDCIVTRLMTFQFRLYYWFWPIGVAYFWCSWIFVLTFIVSCAVAVLRSRKTVAKIMVRNHQEMSESRENLLTI